MTPKPVVHLFSGGLDSTVLFYDLLREGCLVHALLFHYGQSHFKELDYAKRHCRKNDVLFTEIDLSGVFGASSLVGGNGSVVVPNRNAVLISVAVAFAVKVKAEAVIIGCNANDADGFPDCRPEFIEAMQRAVLLAGVQVEICTPYIRMSKRQIVEWSKVSKAPWWDSWSCYGGGAEPCGDCPACAKRKAATE